jgi:predicted Rossmann fold flavoprotein
VNPERVDIAVVGAGAAGLMAAIQAGRVRTHPKLRIVALDGARKLGAKILISGGGRCNVTHHQVDETAFAGSSPPAIRNVLRRFGVEETVAFFRDLGVELKREETGKLFPVTDEARTVLDALLQAAKTCGVDLVYPWRVVGVERTEGGFSLHGEGTAMEAPLEARRVILATGGKSIPKSGSDGQGYALARSLGHSVTPRLLPGLVPLLLAEKHFLRSLSGLSFTARIDLRRGSGGVLKTFTGPVLCAHFGLTGPAIMDMSRYYLDAVLDDPAARLSLCLLPAWTAERLDTELQKLGARTPLSFLRSLLPERLVRALSDEAEVPCAEPGSRLSRDSRRKLVRAFLDLPLPVTGSRGMNYAEVTAGGVPLSEVRLPTLGSRIVPGLHLCGEICDVDGRIGGFNFQWAWASGAVAGLGAAAALDRRAAST